MPTCAIPRLSDGQDRQFLRTHAGQHALNYVCSSPQTLQGSGNLCKLGIVLTIVKAHHHLEVLMSNVGDHPLLSSRDIGVLQHIGRAARRIVGARVARLHAKRRLLLGGGS